MSLSSTRAFLTFGNSLDTSIKAASSESFSFKEASSSSDISSLSKMDEIMVIRSLAFSISDKLFHTLMKVVLTGLSANTSGILFSSESLIPSIISPPVLVSNDFAILLWKEERIMFAKSKPTFLSLIILVISWLRHLSSLFFNELYLSLSSSMQMESGLISS